MANPLKKIIAKAKQLRKIHPNTKWTELVSKASKSLKHGKTKRIPVKRKALRRIATSIARKRKRVGSVMQRVTAPMTTGQMLGAIRRNSEDQLGKLYVRRDKQTTKTGRRKVQKMIGKVKATMRKYSH